MSGYVRVLPRDLFNESSLLKCYGRLWLLLEGNAAAGLIEEDVPGFEIVMNEDSGGITVANLTFKVRGEVYHLERPMNSRRPWPLYLSRPGDDDFDEVDVFTDAGDFTPEFSALIGGPG